jgi:hypothetical protein
MARKTHPILVLPHLVFGKSHTSMSSTDLNQDVSITGCGQNCRAKDHWAGSCIDDLWDVQVVLEYRMDRTVATADDPPVVLGTMPASFVEQMGAKLRCATLYL